MYALSCGVRHNEGIFITNAGAQLSNLPTSEGMTTVAYFKLTFVLM
jgi:hypothetical protein